MVAQPAPYHRHHVHHRVVDHGRDRHAPHILVEHLDHDFGPPDAQRRVHSLALRGLDRGYLQLAVPVNCRPAGRRVRDGTVHRRQQGLARHQGQQRPLPHALHQRARQRAHQVVRHRVPAAEAQHRQPRQRVELAQVPDVLRAQERVLVIQRHQVHQKRRHAAVHALLLPRPPPEVHRDEPAVERRVAQKRRHHGAEVLRRRLVHLRGHRGDHLDVVLHHAPQVMQPQVQSHERHCRLAEKLQNAPVHRLSPAPRCQLHDGCEDQLVQPDVREPLEEVVDSGVRQPPRQYLREAISICLFLPLRRVANAIRHVPVVRPHQRVPVLVEGGLPLHQAAVQRLHVLVSLHAPQQVPQLPGEGRPQQRQQALALLAPRSAIDVVQRRQRREQGREPRAPEHAAVARLHVAETPVVPHAHRRRRPPDG
ncbi:cation-translocating P-type ATPase [Babesia caballi]|uniref:Cation-translocating P-type ATPase n=1 Tax=Babesia caballi TaxID=5871 RepID=A0AAV4LLI1_BABCB|nr:cation-translocating P-type ATPase [Babesia caballi]